MQESVIGAVTGGAPHKPDPAVVAWRAYMRALGNRLTEVEAMRAALAAAASIPAGRPS